MATAPAQFGEGSNSGVSTLTVTLGSPTTAGNLLIAMLSVDGGQTPSGIALTGGSDTFTKDAQVVSTNPTAPVNLSCWSDPSCSGGHTQLVATASASSGLLMLVWEVSGAATSSPLAGAAPGGANPANTLQAAFDSGAGASVAAGCFWVGANTGIGSGGRAQASVTGAWTTETALQPGSATQMLGGYQANAAGGAPEFAGTFTTVTSYWASLALAYKAAAVPVTNRGLLMASIT